MPSRTVLIVHAHPEPRSLNAALKDVAVSTLLDAGHSVEVSDLYSMRWKAAADADDFTERQAGERLRYGADSRQAFESGTLSADIRDEQAKLVRADALILQFPLWWFAPPAILKGWIDRVMSNGFGYGLMRPGATYSARYGEGTFSGKRALVSCTAGGQVPHFSTRGVNGPLADLLFPLTHGMLFYAGFSVLEPFAVHGANRVSDQQFELLADAYRARLAGLFDESPIAYRSQNGGDYDNDLCLKPGLEGALTGLAIHRRP